MKRRPYSKSKARKSFNSRASKTARINLANPLRGGFRL